MAQTGYTPILIYASGTTGNTPSASNLTSSASGAELAINYFDGKLFYKDNAGVVQVLATKGTGAIGGSNTQVQYNSSGALAGSANLTFDGTTLTANALTVTNNPTFSGGTANGVVYLNGSKVVTSGSALTFDGSTFAVNSAASIGSNTAKTKFYSDSAYNGIFNGASLTAAESVYMGGGVLFFFTSGSEQMRLTSTGLGIGTSSPGVRLDVAAPNAAARLVSTTGTNACHVQVNNTGGQLLLGIDNSTGSSLFGTAAYGAGLWYTGNYPLLFGTNNAERMRLDSAGNLGLGVTPSAWGTLYSTKALQVSASSVLMGDVNSTIVGTNYYYDSAFATKYIKNNYALQYVQDGSIGVHKWFNAPSGTAGNTISFTQALTLDASGNLLLGGTSAGASSAASLAIFNGTAPTGSVTNGIILYAEDVSSSSELKVRDEAGNVTTLSPHNFSLIPEGPSEDMAWAYYSEKGGKRINVDMLKLARMVEKLTGEKLVYES